ncbi:alpha-tocopherol transfer protein-like [Melitaea cinxia]|uniref:alpha-tocopherol transfer protein-like n=1 Tax=Melitaea cinxia TaxID=113334 RepID=UPI001E274108|nr:alpha-tocopherol transfer protein-like [Melitaea cinxia]
MDTIPKDNFIEFNTNTLEFIRKQYDLETPERIEEAINLLEDWIKKQPHFMKKDFSRDYLERTIIISKGSVERAKFKLDRICTFRTIYPEFFEVHDVRSYKIINDLQGVFLPKMTSDHYRIFFIKNKAKSFEKGFHDFYRYIFMQCEYIQAHDYCNGLVVILDYRDANMMETLKFLNVNDLRKALEIIKDGYGMRINGMHFLTESNAMDAIVNVFKQVFSAKVAGRLLTHTSLDTLYQYVPKDLLPKEYGGKEKSLTEIQNNFVVELSSKEFTAYLNEMSKACTNQHLRRDNDSYDSGLQGSFRTLSVD